jgi:chemotaxis protein methyltransferase CheR
MDRFTGLKFRGKKSILPNLPRRRVLGDYPSAFKFPMATADLPEEPPMEEVAFVRGVLRRAGLDPENYRLGPLIRRVPACLRAMRVNNVASALLNLAEPGQLGVAVNSLLIGTTGFFRDPGVFEVLEKTVIPALMESGHPPQVWCAACSDGMELYSVAMLCARYEAGHHGRFLGTDCRASAIEVARTGVYSAALAGTVRQELAASYLHYLAGEKVAVRSSLATRIEWRTGDVLTDSEGGGWDMILCRNLAIYLEPGPMSRMWEKLAAALRPGGFLIVGRAEKPQLAGLQRLTACIYKKSACQ